MVCSLLKLKEIIGKSEESDKMKCFLFKYLGLNGLQYVSNLNEMVSRLQLWPK